MADKIKKFFAKKKADAKFKLAGPGHRLSETSVGSQSSVESSLAPMRRLEISEESKVAAQAALARLNLKRENPEFNTSLAAVKAQVKKELEHEKEHAETSTAAPSMAKMEEHKPVSMVATGVFFRCPLISNEVLPRDEWKRNIKTFLYEQLEEERGLTACLIIHSCNNNKEKVEACVETLCKYLENIVQHPDEDKYQKIRLSNRVFQEKVQPIDGALQLLEAAGFVQQKIANSEGVEEDYLVFNKESVPSTDSLVMLIDALRTAEPIQLELDRNLQVLLPSQAAVKINLPPAFFSMTPEEIKKEHQLRLEAAEKSQLLRTKAMREKDELREMRKYKFAVIRVRFPDGVLLQGTFSVYERYIEIHDFVKENLENCDLPFTLTSPGFKLSLEEHANKTLIDLRLVPAAILIFAWHPSVLQQINNSPNRDVFLKPEIMVLVHDL